MLFPDLGSLIEKRRKNLGVTQSDLAEMAEISKNTLYKIEKGQLNPTFKMLNKILDVLGMEVKIEVKNQINK